MNHWLNQLASGWLIATFCHKLIHILWYISHQYSMKIGIYMMIHIWYISILLDLWYPINFPRFLQISYSNDIILTGRLVRAPRDSWLAPARGSSFQRPKKWGESLIWSGWGSHGFHVENRKTMEFIQKSGMRSFKQVYFTNKMVNPRGKMSMFFLKKHWPNIVTIIGQTNLLVLNVGNLREWSTDYQESQQPPFPTHLFLLRTTGRKRRDPTWFDQSKTSSTEAKNWPNRYPLVMSNIAIENGQL